MSSLRERLKRMQSSGEITVRSPAAFRRPEPAAAFFPGEEKTAQTVYGSCYFREIAFPLDYRHGSGQLAELLSCCGADLVLPAKEPALAEFVPAEALFLDIETTGLAGGTGTLAFLVGLGWYRNGRFVIRQYFLPDPSREAAMLHHITETMSRFPGIVTFNGKTFDLPLVRTRQVLHGMEEAAKGCFHLDLLPCARRLWKERLASCSLKSLETALLGLERVGDVPGAEIPAVYFHYLRTGDTDRLRTVFEHNVWDILSMVRLLAFAARAAAGKAVTHPADNFAVGKLYEEQGCQEAAAEFYRKAASCRNRQLQYKAKLHLSLLYKRQGKWQEAKAIWKELLRNRCENPVPYLELAKYYEHRAKNFSLALAMTEYLLAQGRHLAPSGGQLSREALLYRRERLLRKIKGPKERIEAESGLNGGRMRPLFNCKSPAFVVKFTLADK